VRSVYFLGTLTNVRYRKLRHLRRPDAATLVCKEIESDPYLTRLLEVAGTVDGLDSAPDILDDVLGAGAESGPLTALVSLVASKGPEDSVRLGESDVIAIDDLVESLQSAITAAADEAEEDQRDQTAQTAPLNRVEKAIAELERGLAALPKARTFTGFDEAGMAERVERLKALADKYPDEDA